MRAAFVLPGLCLKFARLTSAGAAADADLARVVAAWPNLPDPIRRAVLALIGSVTG